MKIRKQNENEYFGRFEENEELVTRLTEFLEEEDIQSGIFSIIGSLKKSKFGYYDRIERKYKEMQMDEYGEILHCTGNITLKEGKPFPHCHITLAAPDGSAYGGHLMAGKIFAADIYIKKFDKPVKRLFDESTGLHLVEP
ncbi:MAG: PPC domain-containing DNA-binding protein [archaeon]